MKNSAPAIAIIIPTMIILRTDSLFQAINIFHELASANNTCNLIRILLVEDQPSSLFTVVVTAEYI
jgi:hypothetical protein